MILYDFILQYLLPLFIPSSLLTTIIVGSFTIGNLFSVMFCLALFYVIIWFLIVLPFKWMRKLMHMDKKGR